MCSVLFYISGDTIYLKTLNGLMDQLTCVPSSTVTPTAIAVDSVESVLYWIHGREDFTTINSLHYSEQSCDERYLIANNCGGMLPILCIMFTHVCTYVNFLLQFQLSRSIHCPRVSYSLPHLINKLWFNYTL